MRSEVHSILYLLTLAVYSVIYCLIYIHIKTGKEIPEEADVTGLIQPPVLLSIARAHVCKSHFIAQRTKQKKLP